MPDYRAYNDNVPAVDIEKSAPSNKGTTVNSPCPICDKRSQEKYHPFCSKRCADLDLGRWLSGGYAIAGQEDAEEDGALPLQEQHLDKKTEEIW